MSGWKKLANAPAASGGLNIEEVFSTYLYEGNGGSSQSIDNGIDLSGEGGMALVKRRNGAQSWILHDSEMSTDDFLMTNSADAVANYGSSNVHFITGLTSTGFTVGNQPEVNASSGDYASWAFRKAPKFFDVVRYTGDGQASKTISHNLGSTPGMVIVKAVDQNYTWYVAHRSIPNAFQWLAGNYATSSIPQTKGKIFASDFTSTTFMVREGTTNGNDVNRNGTTYVAYVFAHNDGDGEFGPTGDQDIIKCGGWSSSGSATVDLGFEPQWILIKPNTTADWAIYDVMRGQLVGGAAQELYPNKTSTEGSGGLFGTVSPNPTGFSVTSGYNVDHIYVAIRRGPMALPENGTDVFEPVAYTGNGDYSGQDLDFTGMDYSDLSIIMPTNFAGYCLAWTRLRSEVNAVRTNSSLFDAAYDPVEFDHMHKVKAVYQANFTPNQNTRPYVSFHWQRAPSFFDVVLYEGNGTSGHVIDHNLGVVPEMMWVKNLTDAENWAVYYGDNTDYLKLNENAATVDDNTIWNDTSPTVSNFTVGSNFAVNESGSVIAAYLFATLSGVSKVGSYTGNGTSQTINCGFSSGARFIMVKRKDSTGNWYVWNSDRGIVAGNDPYIQFDTAATENVSTDLVDPHSSGFIVNGTTVNASGGEYIFYAIA